jgi:hypothetical protein
MREVYEINRVRRGQGYRRGAAAMRSLAARFMIMKTFVRYRGVAIMVGLDAMRHGA